MVWVHGLRGAGSWRRRGARRGYSEGFYRTKTVDINERQSSLWRPLMRDERNWMVTAFDTHERQRSLDGAKKATARAHRAGARRSGTRSSRYASRTATLRSKSNSATRTSSARTCWASRILGTRETSTARRDGSRSLRGPARRRTRTSAPYASRAAGATTRLRDRRGPRARRRRLRRKARRTSSRFWCGPAAGPRSATTRGRTRASSRSRGATGPRGGRPERPGTLPASGTKSSRYTSNRRRLR